MFPEPAARDCEGEAGLVLGGGAAFLEQKRAVPVPVEQPAVSEINLNWGCRTDGRSLVVMFAIFRGQHDVKNQDFQHRLELDFPGET